MDANNNNDDRLPFVRDTKTFRTGCIEIKKTGGQGNREELVLETLRQFRASLLSSFQKNYDNVFVTIELSDKSNSTMTKEIGAALVQTFQDFAAREKAAEGAEATITKTLHWSLYLTRFVQGCIYHKEVLKEACLGGLFESIRIEGVDYKAIMSHESACALQNAMISNPRLKSIHVHNMKHHDKSVLVLSEGLKKTKNLTRLHISTRLYPSSYPSCPVREPTDAWQYFLEGIRDNNSLKSLDLVAISLPNHKVLELIDAMVGHPTITEISFLTNRLDEPCERALHRLMSSPVSNITKLSLKCRFNGMDPNNLGRQTITDITQFCGAIRESRKLEKLILSGYDLRDSGNVELLFFHVAQRLTLRQVSLVGCKIGMELSEIFGILLGCPNLEMVDLSGNKISKLGCFDIPPPALGPTQLRELRLDYNPLVTAVGCGGRQSEDPAPATQFLKESKKLCMLLDLSSYSVGEVFCAQAKDILDTNMINCIQGMPISCWSMMLHKISCRYHTQPSYGASVVFTLIKGIAHHLSAPAFS